MESYSKNLTIKQWAEDDRPREKLLMKGRHSMTDAELLAILIGSGTKEETAVDLAKRILSTVSGNLGELARQGISDLMKIKGIGPARAILITAAMELGKRRNQSEVIVKDKISCSRDVFEVLKCAMGDQPYEEFWILILNKANRVIRKCCISEGGISGTVVDPKKIFKIALDHHASSIILGHNHPSGNVQPSEADQKITRKIRESGLMLDIAVLDHVILGDGNYFSFADEGII
ncbi:MAG TPA: DNA repair protein RadC [Bacteroidales bacterium]|nr:DNA repair protein RadC [Bacteroidales bacterium]HPS73836.1 DNA repair protein RadC [Bacteroidales bacterium]